MTTINKKTFKIDKIQILRDLDLLLKIRHQQLKVWCLANNLLAREVKNSETKWHKTMFSFLAVLQNCTD